MYTLYTLSNPELTQKVLYGRQLRSQAMAAAAYQAVKGIYLLVRAVSRGLARAGGAVARWHRRRQTVRQLQAMDSRMLRDIGITRGEIYSVVLAMEEAEKNGDTAADWARERRRVRETEEARRPQAAPRQERFRPAVAPAPQLRMAGCG